MLFLYILIFIFISLEEPERHDRCEQFGEDDGIPDAVECRFVTRTENIEENYRYGDDG